CFDGSETTESRKGNRPGAGARYRMAIDWGQYRSTGFYDELIEAPGRPRPAAQRLADYLAGLSGAELAERRAAAELAIKTMGVTFTVYSEGRNVDRSWPFDIIPRT